MKYSFVVEEYRKNQLKSLKLLKPNLSEEFLLEFIDKQIEKDFINPKVKIHNNYKGITAGQKGDWNLNKFFIWYNQRKPIITEHGVMFMRHEQAPNHLGDLSQLFLSERKVNKKKMLQAKDAGNLAEADTYDVIQKVWKILANSLYGVLGQSSSYFFNLYVAMSVTGKGQSIISTAMTTFENFLSGTIKYNTLDELISFIISVKETPSKECRLKMRNISEEELIAKLKKDCIEGLDINEEYIKQAISSCTEDEKQRLFFKNNLMTYLAEESVLGIISSIINGCEEFRCAEEADSAIVPYLESLWESVEYYVYDKRIKFDKINILKTHERESVLGVSVLAPVKLF